MARISILPSGRDDPREAVIDNESGDPSKLPPGPWKGRWIHPPHGRSDDWFTYDGTDVHSHVFRSQFAAHSAVTEYQVTQAADGADIAVVANGPFDSAALSDAVAASYAALASITRPST